MFLVLVILIGIFIGGFLFLKKEKWYVYVQRFENVFESVNFGGPRSSNGEYFSEIFRIRVLGEGFLGGDFLGYES